MANFRERVHLRLTDNAVHVTFRDTEKLADAIAALHEAEVKEWRNALSDLLRIIESGSGKSWRAWSRELHAVRTAARALLARKEGM